MNFAEIRFDSEQFVLRKTTATQQAEDEPKPGFLSLTTRISTFISNFHAPSRPQLTRAFASTQLPAIESTANMADNPSAAWPLADEALSQAILDLVQQAGHYRQL